MANKAIKERPKEKVKGKENPIPRKEERIIQRVDMIVEAHPIPQITLPILDISTNTDDEHQIPIGEKEKAKANKDLPEKEKGIAAHSSNYA